MKDNVALCYMTDEELIAETVRTLRRLDESRLRRGYTKESMRTIIEFVRLEGFWANDDDEG